MEGLNFYYTLEYNDLTQISDFSLNEFSSIVCVMSGSRTYKDYDQCSRHIIKVLTAKQQELNALEGLDRYSIFFEKNQFNTIEGWTENEVIKLYVADSLETTYNSLIKARVYFVPNEQDAAFIFEAPATLQ